MGVRKSCRNCLYFIKSKSYCLLLNRAVNSLDSPPCIANSSSNSMDVVQSQVGLSSVPQTVNQEYRLQSATQAGVVGVSVSQPRTALPKPVSNDYAPTGIPKLDEILGGGFLRGKTYLVAGEAGCGKTIFSVQFLVYGAYFYDEPGVYIAIDEPTNQLLRGLERFGWDVRSLVSQGKLLFLDMRTHFSKIYLRDERRKIEPRYVIETILNAAKKIRAKRLVIDPIAPLVYGGKEEDVLYAREFLREMVFAIERVGELTTILTSEIPTGSTKLSRFGVEEFLASGIVVLSIEEIEGEIERVMYIRKARWSPVKPSKYIFDIVMGQGIVIRESLSEYLRRYRSM